MIGDKIDPTAKKKRPVTQEAKSAAKCVKHILWATIDENQDGIHKRFHIAMVPKEKNYFYENLVKDLTCENDSLEKIKSIVK